MSPATIMDTTLPSTNSALFNIPKLADDGLNWITPFEVDKTTNKLKKPDGTTLVKQQIFSTISDQLLLRVQNLGSASKIWDEICKIHEGKTELVQIDLRRRLQELRCDEGRDIKAHFTEQLRLRESLAGMGASIDDRDFYAITLGSLPESYRPPI